MDNHTISSPKSHAPPAQPLSSNKAPRQPQTPAIGEHKASRDSASRSRSSLGGWIHKTFAGGERGKFRKVGGTKVRLYQGFEATKSLGKRKVEAPQSNEPRLEKQPGKFAAFKKLFRLPKIFSHETPPSDLTLQEGRQNFDIIEALCSERIQLNIEVQRRAIRKQAGWATRSAIRTTTRRYNQARNEVNKMFTKLEKKNQSILSINDKAVLERRLQTMRNLAGL